MDKTKKRRIIFLILMLLWMALIFWFSSRDGDESSEDSIEVGLMVCHIAVPGFDEMTWDQQFDLARSIDFLVRKTAHFTEYLLLAQFALGTFLKDERRKNAVLFAWLTATGYAVTDEIHQLFVPGRAGMVQDVLIDSSGALTGCFICLLGMHLVNRRRMKKKNGR